MATNKLTHYPLCPLSRTVRLALGELEIDVALTEERPWEWRAQFLALNPSGELPVLELDGVAPMCGAYAICEYLGDGLRRMSSDRPPVHLIPGTREDKAEIRRLVDWFHRKFDREVTRDLLDEKVYVTLAGQASPAPNLEILRATRMNLRYHMSYLSFLADQRRWLAGDELSLADLAAAAHLSIADYLGEVPWDEHVAAKGWYQRLKSRRSFRPLLADRVPGLPPPLAYTDLDF
jgi:glutathione S-transferase